MACINSQLQGVPYIDDVNFKKIMWLLLALVIFLLPIYGKNIGMGKKNEKDDCLRAKMKLIY